MRTQSGINVLTHRGQFITSVHRGAVIGWREWVFFPAKDTEVVSRLDEVDPPLWRLDESTYKTRYLKLPVGLWRRDFQKIR